MSECVILQSDQLCVEVSPLGAELRSVRDRQGREWLWQGDAQSWPRRAPVLFPVVGRCRDGVIRHRGRIHAMPAHGFAPDSRFFPQVRAHDACAFSLEADDHTRAAFPFEFRLEVSFALRDGTLVQVATVTNLSREAMPSSVGFHPGFKWPLAGSEEVERTRYAVRFEAAEHHPVRRPKEGLIDETPHATPVRGRELFLHDDLFRPGALVFERRESRRVWFGAAGREGVLVDLCDMPYLGIWTLPGAGFLCIEPWQGYGDPVSFHGEIRDKPGMVLLSPGESYERSMHISFNCPAPF